MKAQFVKEIEVTDPDSNAPVHISIYKLANGAMVGFDSSFMEQVEEGPYNPYDYAGAEIQEEERGSYWQPDLEHPSVIEAEFPSFGVFETEEACKKAFPEAEAKCYFGDDIEDPTYFDEDLSAM